MNKSFPRVSVIIPIWNTEKYLKKCLDSIANQTLKDIEIICVNNGSDDSCPQIIERYAKNDARIKVVNKEHGCLSGARNAGIAVATAPYLTFVDSDDWIEPECYELAVTEFEKDPDIDIVCWGANIVNIDLPEDAPSITGGKKYHNIKYVGKKELNDQIILNTTVCVWNKMYKTKIIQQNDVKFPLNLELEDNSFYYTYIVNCKFAYYLDKYFYNYVQRKNSGFERILNGHSDVIAPHLKNLIFICDYYKKQNILEKKLAFILSKLKNYYRFDYEHTQSENQIKVVQKAKEIIDKLPLDENIKKDPDILLNNKPILVFGKTNMGLFKIFNTNRYILNICGIKISFKRKGKSNV